MFVLWDRDTESLWWPLAGTAVSGPMIGRPLPRDVILYDVPPPLLVRLPPPRAGHRYVRVAGDILMIAIGTALVVDAITDLGG